MLTNNLHSLHKFWIFSSDSEDSDDSAESEDSEDDTFFGYNIRNVSFDTFINKKK